MDFETILDTVQCGNSIDLLRAMPDNSIDMIFTDPPYGHNNNNNGDLIQRIECAMPQRRSKTSALRGTNIAEPARAIANDGAEANDLFVSFLKESRRVLKPGACCCCCCGGGGPDPQFARWSLWMDEIIGFKMAVVWDKGPMGMGWHYRRSYELVLVAQKPGAACKWYDETNAIENVIRPGMGAPKILPSRVQHPTEKPVGLAAHFIRLHSRTSEIVLDPFAGSGSTLLAARNMQRHFIGIELDPQWAEYARERLAQPYTLPMFNDTPEPPPPDIQLGLFDTEREP